jgi:hypothetical protein
MGAADRCRMRGGRAAISDGTKVLEENLHMRPDQHIRLEERLFERRLASVVGQRRDDSAPACNTSVES